MKNKTKKNKKKSNEKNENQLFDFDNEIVIGIKTYPEEKKSNKKKNKKKNKNPATYKSNKQKKTKKKTKESDIELESIMTETKNKRVKTFVKWVFLITLIAGIVLFLLTSPLFNITEITVENNYTVTKDEIINLSGIKIGDNAFKINQLKVENKLKNNPYIESVKLKRVLPSEIKIIVKERKATYMLETPDSQFAYINNQGYILEINSQPTNLPKITSYLTPELNVGGRLNNDDLDKLEVVLKIMEIANANQIGTLITGINIESKNNFILYMETEKKTIYLGNASDINTKMLYIKATLEDEKGIEGELYMDGKTNKEGEFLFREKV